LRDGIFENQTVENFQTVYNSKVLTTKYLDVASEGVSKDLEYFVTFSSISCGRGNRGQTNYGYANSIMERISEQRQKRGLPAVRSTKFHCIQYIFHTHIGTHSGCYGLNVIILYFISQQSIQWGGIGDVGMAYLLTRGNEEKEINGTLAQKISSCLAALDTLLTQSSAVVASHVIPTKRKLTENSKSQSLTEIVSGIMGNCLYYINNQLLRIDYLKNYRHF